MRIRKNEPLYKWPRDVLLPIYIYTCDVWWYTYVSGAIYVGYCSAIYMCVCVCVYTMMILEGPRKTLSTDRPFLLAHRPQPFITVMNSTAAHRLLNHNFSRTRSSIAFSPPRKYIYIYKHSFACEFGYICASCRESARLEFIHVSVYIYTHYIVTAVIIIVIIILTLFACVAFRILLYIPFFLSPPPPFSDGRAINHSGVERYSARATRLSLVARAVLSSTMRRTPFSAWKISTYFTHTHTFIFIYILWHHLNVRIFIYNMCIMHSIVFLFVYDNCIPI